MRFPFSRLSHHLPRRAVMLAAASLAALGVGTAQASDYPASPINMVVPFAAGGPTDKVARDLAEAMRKPLGQTLVVDNVGGAGGTRGAAKAAKASPDGYTLLLHHIGMSTAQALYRTMPYKVPDDFEFIGLINEVPMTLVAKPQMAASSYAELVQWLTANKDKANLAHAGLGSASHLCGLLFMQSIKTDLVTIPYQGTGPAMQALVQNQVDVMCDQSTNTSSQIAAGAIKAYAVTTPKRVSTPALAKLPTLDELGLKGFNVSIWHGLYAPKGTPKAVLDRLQAALKVAMADSEFQKRQEALGAVIVTDNRTQPAEHRKWVEAEIAKWTPVIRAAGQYAD